MLALEGIYQQLLIDMVQIQNEYYMPLLCVGLVVTAFTLIMYLFKNKTKHKKTESINSSINSMHSSSKHHSKYVKSPSLSSVQSSHLTTSKSTYNLPLHDINNNSSQSSSLNNNNNQQQQSLNNHSSSAPQSTILTNNKTSLHHSFSSSLLERTNIPNQKYRKQDPNTRYDDDGTRYQCVSIPYRINKETNKVFI